MQKLLFEKYKDSGLYTQLPIRSGLSRRSEYRSSFPGSNGSSDKWFAVSREVV